MAIDDFAIAYEGLVDENARCHRPHEANTGFMVVPQRRELWDDLVEFARLSSGDLPVAAALHRQRLDSTVWRMGDQTLIRSFLKLSGDARRRHREQKHKVVLLAGQCGALDAICRRRDRRSDGRGNSIALCGGCYSRPGRSPVGVGQRRYRDTGGRRRDRVAVGATPPLGFGADRDAISKDEQSRWRTEMTNLGSRRRLQCAQQTPHILLVRVP